VRDLTENKIQHREDWKSYQYQIFWFQYHLRNGIIRNFEKYSPNYPCPICFYCRLGSQHVTDDYAYIDCSKHKNPFSGFGLSTDFRDVCGQFQYSRYYATWSKETQMTADQYLNELLDKYPNEDRFGNRSTWFNDECPKCGYRYFVWPWKVTPGYPIKSDYHQLHLECGRCNHKFVEQIVKG
jgi:hypothetical protein